MLKERLSGILLPIFSLPGSEPIGTFNQDAFSFIDFLHSSGQSVWQILPLNSVDLDGSPYNSKSAFAGNILHIDLFELEDKKLLTKLKEKLPFFENKTQVNYPLLQKYKITLLKEAFNNFTAQKSNQKEDFTNFCKKNSFWLDDFALFSVLDNHFDNKSWIDWPEELKFRKKSTLVKFEKDNKKEIEFIKFTQWLFFSQWQKLKNYANKKNIEIWGDMPIFVSFDSADVWANQSIFQIKKGIRKSVAGVPPDYFSENGQLWGNPLYDWKKLKQENFLWWQKRFETMFELYDSVRLDHFRGFEAYWKVPAKEKTAINGKWIKVPGKEFFKKMKSVFKNFKIIAEDLGNITKEVTNLRDGFNFPGMKVLQFAFSDVENLFFPHNFSTKNCVVYTGTHDNDTLLGWYKSLDNNQKSFVNYYIDNYTEEKLVWKMIRVAFSSIANVAIIPFQDFLQKDSVARLNTPGQSKGNWRWRFIWNEVPFELKDSIKGLTQVYNRIKK